MILDGHRPVVRAAGVASTPQLSTADPPGAKTAGAEAEVDRKVIKHHKTIIQAEKIWNMHRNYTSISDIDLDAKKK